MSERGKYIVLEGGEYVGKSTQARRLAESIGALAVFEPGYTEPAKVIRRLLLDPAIQTAPVTDLLLHAAARAELMSTVVEPALAQGQHVVSDRSWLSSAAYQGAQGLDYSVIKRVNEIAVGPRIRPDLLFILDADPRELASRKTMAEDYYEQMGVDFHAKTREIFLDKGTALGGIVVNALASVDQVSEQLLQMTQSRLGIETR